MRQHAPREAPLALLLVAMALGGCDDPITEPDIELTPDAPVLAKTGETVIALPDTFTMGPAFIELTSIPTESMLAHLSAAGLAPAPGYDKVLGFKALKGAAGSLDQNVAEKLARLPFVTRIGSAVAPDGIHTMGYMWNIDRVQAPEAWANFNNGYNNSKYFPYIAVIDAGMDTAYHELSGYDPWLWHRQPLYQDMANTGRASDDIGWGHGTAVASFLAGDVHSPVHVSGTPVVGVAPRAYLQTYNIMDGTGSTYQWTHFVDALDRVIIERPEAVNMSVGNCGRVPDDFVHNAIKEVAKVTTRYGAYGTVMVAAAGNGTAYGKCSDQKVAYPAAYPEVIGVTAIDGQYEYPNPNYAQGAKVELAAPGINVTYVGPGLQTGTTSGTSYATPHVTGAVAIMRAENPSWSASKIRQRLRETARDVYTSGRDYETGYGLIQIHTALSSFEANLSGPTSVTEAGYHEWTSSPTGGASPYTYKWYWSGVEQSDTDGSFGLLLNEFDNGYHTVRVLVEDANGTTVWEEFGIDVYIFDGGCGTKLIC